MGTNLRRRGRDVPAGTWTIRSPPDGRPRRADRKPARQDRRCRCGRRPLSTPGRGPRSARRGSMLDMADDAWLSDLLRHGALSDTGVAQELAATFAARDPSVDSDGIATRALLTALEETWERGWQPADVVHVARREATTGSVPLVVALIAEHARRSDAAFRAPDAWMEQLSELGALTPGDPAVVSAWHRTGRR